MADVVALLDAQIALLQRAYGVNVFGAGYEALRRARDEIAALREDNAELDHARAEYRAALRVARAEALEEAAGVCDKLTDPTTAKLYDEGCEDCAAAIRALKERGDEC